MPGVGVAAAVGEAASVVAAGVGVFVAAPALKASPAVSAAARVTETAAFRSTGRNSLRFIFIPQSFRNAFAELVHGLLLIISIADDFDFISMSDTRPENGQHALCICRDIARRKRNCRMEFQCFLTEARSGL